MIKKTLLSTAILASLTATPALAYQAGDFVVRAGITTVTPQDNSGPVFAGGSPAVAAGAVTVDENSQLGLNFLYIVNENLGIELLAATPFAHDIALNGAALGSTKQLPPSLMAIYFPMGANSDFQPYIGAGINYTIFFSEDFETSQKGTFSELSVDDSWGLTAQIGFDYMLSDKMIVNASVRYADIDTTADFKINGTPSSVDVDIDPFVTSVMLGYKF